MDIDPVLKASPHAHDRSGVERVMLQVCLALIPLTAFGFYLFGLPAILLWTVTCVSAVLAELVCLWLRGRSWRDIGDSSALLSGWLLALTLPPWAPWWIGAGGAVVAVAIGKQLYGGLGQNVFNPALLARVALLISFPVQMTTWILPVPLGSDAAPDLSRALAIVFDGSTALDGYTGATLLGELKAVPDQQTVATVVGQHFVLANALSGHTAGSLGETSTLLVLLGGAWLLFQRIISWHIPTAMLATTALLASISHLSNPQDYAPPLVHLTSGGLMLAAFFFATDYVTSPTSALGRLIFGAGCGALLFAIRAWGNFPESAAFAILFMNALTPLIDRFCRPRIYGRNWRGKPLGKPPARRIL